MENVENMAKVIEKVRRGPKKKDPQDRTAPVTFYVVIKDIEEMGGLDFAKVLGAQKLAEYLKKVRAGKVKPGVYA